MSHLFLPRNNLQEDIEDISKIINVIEAILFIIQIDILVLTFILFNWFHKENKKSTIEIHR